jgi:hypothetical protein
MSKIPLVYNPSIDEMEPVTQEWLDNTQKSASYIYKRNEIIIAVAKLNIHNNRDLINQIALLLKVITHA